MAYCVVRLQMADLKEDRSSDKKDEGGRIFHRTFAKGKMNLQGISESDSHVKAALKLLMFATVHKILL